MTHQTDLSRLARLACGGDVDALDRLLELLQPEVVRVVRLVVGSGSQVAEDAAQDALLEIARDVRSLRAPESVRAWALRLATRRGVHAAKRERLRSCVSLAPVSEQQPASPSASLKRAFDALPPRLRAVAVLRLYVGLSEEETATVLECAVGTVKSHLHDARRRLQTALEAEGVRPVADLRRSQTCP